MTSSSQRGLAVRRLVLADGVTEEDVQRVADDLRWRLTRIEEARAEDDPRGGTFRSLYWRASDETIAYSLVWDELPYVVIQTRAQDDADEAARNLQTARPALFYSPDEILRTWDDADDEEQAASAAFHLGLIASPSAGPEVPIFERMAAALRHKSPSVRAAATRGFGYARWPELRPILKGIAENDADEDVRETAAAVYDAYEHFGWI